MEQQASGVHSIKFEGYKDSPNAPKLSGTTPHHGPDSPFAKFCNLNLTFDDNPTPRNQIKLDPLSQ